LRHVSGAADLPRIESDRFDADADSGPDSGGHHKQHDGIPRLKVDPEDTAASVILAAGAVGDPERRLALFDRALKQHPQSVELQLRRIDELVTLARFTQAEAELANVQAAHAADWRLAWYRGRCLLAQGKTQETLAAFEGILNEMPGELAPKQAVARAYEAGGEFEKAISYYDAVSRADPAFTSAAFGLARCLEHKGDKAGAAEAYRRVPSSSSRYAPAQMALARLLLSRGTTLLPDLLAASDAVEAVMGQIEGVELHELRAELFTAAALFIERTAQWSDSKVLGISLRAPMLRAAAEGELRTCARMATSNEERIRRIDEANRVRPLTWV
jgi:serine/threonine-protein kinase PknG